MQPFLQRYQKVSIGEIVNLMSVMSCQEQQKNTTMDYIFFHFQDTNLGLQSPLLELFLC